MSFTRLGESRPFFKKAWSAGRERTWLTLRLLCRYHYSQPSATALFSFSLTDLSSSTPVTALDLGHPILDFYVVASAATPTLFVSVDTPESSTPGLISVSAGPDSVCPSHLRISAPYPSGQADVLVFLFHLQLSVVETPSSLLTSPHLLSSPAPPPAPLEKKAGKTKAPRSPDGNLHLYQLLAEMPKWSKEGEDDDGEAGDDAEEKAVRFVISSRRINLTPAHLFLAFGGDHSQISKKETGRRKNNGGIPSLPNLGAPHKKHRAAAAAPSATATPQPEEDDEAAMMNEA